MLMQSGDRWAIIRDITPGLYVYASDLNLKTLVVHTIYEPNDLSLDSSKLSLCKELSEFVDLSTIDIILVQLINKSWSAFSLSDLIFLYHDISIELSNDSDDTDIALSLINTPSMYNVIRVH